MPKKPRRRKEQKRTRRRRRLDKERNLRANRARFRYRLDVMWEGEWRTAKRFRTAAEAQAHLDETEAIRRRGDTEIVEGRVVDLNSLSGKVVARVMPFHLEVGPSMEEAREAVEGAGQALPGVGRENFNAPVGISERPAVGGRENENAAGSGGEGSLTIE